MIKAGIIGGTGYTGGELIWLLLHHPSVELQFVFSNSQAGKAVGSVHLDLLGETDLVFTNKVEEDVDIIFLCLPHGTAKKFVQEQNLPERIKIVDLSNDFRLRGDHTYVYGLPELQKEAIKEANFVANPGCFATAIQLGLLPLAKEKQLKDEVHIHAITGSTGAGAGLSATTHFSWRNNNISTYKEFQHQHLGEIWQSLRQLDNGYDKDINFVPVRGDFARGIFASMYVQSDLSKEQALELYRNYYADAPFVVVADANISLKEVVNTNKCFIQVQKHGSKLLIGSAIDNLLKGASGQAVQNMNLVFGFEETAGLKLKPSRF